MLRILEQKDLSAYEEQLSPLVTGTEGLHLTEAKENDDVKGFIAYAYESEQVVIYALDDGGDLNYCDGLVRSVLFKAELRGLERAVFQVEGAAILKQLKTLGFVKNDEKILENIADIMGNCRKCGENPANT